MTKGEALRDFLTGLEEAIPLLQQTQDVLEDLAGAADIDYRGWSKVWRGQDQAAASNAKVSAVTRRKNRQRLAEGLEALEGQLKTATAWLQPLQGADARRSDLLQQLESTASDLQVALVRLAAVEGERQQALDRLRSLGVDVPVGSSGVTGAAGSSPALGQKNAALGHAVADEQRAAERALQAEQRLAVHERTAQEARAALAGAQAAAEKARAAGQKHQAAVAALTGDNLVLLLRARSAEEGGAALRGERDELRAQLEEQKGPWFEEVRAGVRAKVAASLQRVEALEAQLDTQAAAAAQLRDAHAAEAATLKQQAADAHTAGAALSAQLQAAQWEAERAVNKLVEVEAAAKEDRQSALEAAAENRILSATLRCVQDECQACKENQRAVEDKAAGLEDAITQLQQKVASVQVLADAATHELHTQKDINGQLMNRKEETEWQLMAALAHHNEAQQITAPPVYEFRAGREVHVE